MSERYEKGMKIRRKVLGDAHVDRAEAQKSEFDAAFQEMITEGAWGTVWARNTIPLRERSMLTIALLAATGNFAEIPMHIRATANTGATREDVMEALLHVAVYAGVPKANHAIKLARDTYAEMEEDNG
ncbi:4-carboxymuconolactone decarboxylase [Silicimonas sp. MF1-12-2]|jgi:4-carboxymuconolactone decarboxylase|uniref:4-carboxymuconolactone decarboxylase n=1 Tax=Silicimonas sp. MF1-12-2 TaxID=3384793 RepID=UPI0039B60CBE